MGIQFKAQAVSLGSKWGGAGGKIMVNGGRLYLYACTQTD